MKKLVKLYLWFDTLKDYLISIVLPKRCMFCGKVISVKEKCCSDCSSKLPLAPIVCYAYSKKYLCVASFPYKDMYRKSVIDLKFHDMKQNAKTLAVFLARDIKSCYDDVEFDIITSVPLHKKQVFDREYNQSKLIAKRVAMILGVQYKDTIIKHKNNLRQHNLNPHDRIKNVRGVYKIKDKKSVRNKKVLIIDDIITTGNTLLACSKVLETGGAELVCTAAVCSA